MTVAVEAGRIEIAAAMAKATVGIRRENLAFMAAKDSEVVSLEEDEEDVRVVGDGALAG